MRTTRAANGRSSIYRDASGTWHGWVSMGRDENGRAVRRHVRGRTKADVTGRVTDLEAQRRGTAQLAATNGRQSLGQWLQEWLVQVKRSRKPRPSPPTSRSSAPTAQRCETPS
jgi:hypothetical protein